MDAIDDIYHVLKPGVMLDFGCGGHFALLAPHEASVFNTTRRIGCTQEKNKQAADIDSGSVCATMPRLLRREPAISKCRALYLGAKRPKMARGQGLSA
jgi:hypothetical protein